MPKFSKYDDIEQTDKSFALYRMREVDMSLQESLLSASCRLFRTDLDSGLNTRLSKVRFLGNAEERNIYDIALPRPLSQDALDELPF